MAYVAFRSWWRRHWWPTRIRQLDRERQDWKRWTHAAEARNASELLERAWGVIANAGWDGLSPTEGWQEAAVAWRDAYHEHLDALAQEHT